MSIMRRVRDISIATLNEMLENSEDPIRLIDRYLYEQKEQIDQAERILAQSMHHANNLKQQYLTAEKMKEKREEQALIALKAGEEHISRLALQEKMLHEEKAQQYKELYDQTMQSIAELESQLAQLKADYQEVLSKRSYYLARIETLRLQQRMNASMNSLGQRYSPHMFSKLEERVTDMELEARSLRDLRQMGREVMYQAGTTLQQALEAELERLRKKLDEEGRSK